MADFAKLDQAQADVVAKMDALVASVADLAAKLANPPVPVEDPVIQAHIDAVAAGLEAEVAKASPAPAPVAPVAPAAPAAS